MDRDPTHPSEPARTSPARRLNRLCDRFEVEWRAGRQPDIASYLAEVREPEQPSLLRELIALELELRNDQGERPTPSEYLQRFPEHTELIDQVFGEATFLVEGPESGIASDAESQYATGTFVDATSPTLTSPFSTDTPTSARSGSPSEPRFRILHRHASGGLGEVLVARDEQLHREVALKRIRDRYADDPRSRSRFLREAEITGRLEHPGIVPVHALGVSPEGRPYYIMKLVRGESLRKAIQRFHRTESPDLRDTGARVLELRGLLRRFLDVCDAIAYAHSRGILHRDIKPSNILLGPYGETLVVDWGMARSVATEAGGTGSGSAEGWLHPQTDDGVELTQAGTRLGTPSYMSPEQAAGQRDQVGPASDIYGLGATLYCLLTGRAPFDDPRSEAEVEAVLSQVRAGAFPPPRQVNPLTPPALEAICLKALARRPEDRYGSVPALAEDIERWLADEPVTAWREPWTTRAKRRLARHRTLVTTAAASILVALVSLAVLLALQTRAKHAMAEINAQLIDANLRERSARTLAQAQLALARDAIEAHFTGVSEDVLLEEPQLEQLRTRLLETPLEFYRRLGRILEDSGASDPETLADLADAYFRLGTVTDRVGRKEDAVVAHQQALALRERLAAGDPASPQLQADLGASYLNLASLNRDQSQYGEALEYAEQAVAVYQRLATTEPDNDTFQDRLATCYTMLGTTLNETNRHEEAMQVYQRAQPLRERLAQSHPDSHTFQLGLAALHNNIGKAHSDLNQGIEALEGYRCAIATVERLAELFPDDAEIQHSLALYHTNFGRTSWSIDLDQALQAYQDAIACGERAVRTSPTVTRYQENLARSYYQIGYLHFRSGRLEEALAPLHEAVAIRERLAQANPTILRFQVHLAFGLGTLGNVQADLKHFDDAAQTHRKAIAVREHLVRSYPDELQFREGLARSYHNMASLFLPNASDQPDEALAWYRKALPLQSDLVSALPEDPFYHNDLAKTLYFQGIALGRSGRGDEAVASLRHAIEEQHEAIARAPGVERFHQELDQLYRDLCATLLEGDRPEEAAAAALKRRELGRDDPNTLYDMARQLALCAIPTPGATTQGGELGDQAMTTLRRAIQRGFDDLERLRSDPDLDPLRTRDDFQLLLWDLAFPSQPFGEDPVSGPLR